MTIAQQREHVLSMINFHTRTLTYAKEHWKKNTSFFEDRGFEQGHIEQFKKAEEERVKGLEKELALYQGLLKSLDTVEKIGDHIEHQKTLKPESYNLESVQVIHKDGSKFNIKNALVEETRKEFIVYSQNHKPITFIKKELAQLATINRLGTTIVLHNSK